VKKVRKILVLEKSRKRLSLVYEKAKGGNNSTRLRCAVQTDEARLHASELCKRLGGVMRISRDIIIPAILALGAAGSIVAASAVPAVAAQAPAAHVQASAVSAHPDTWYYG
jgi:hypothetical protein